MVSKKIIGPALAGTGAVGTPGALAWALSLFDDGNQENNVKETATPPERPKVETKSKREFTRTGSAYLSSNNAPDDDKKVINNKNSWAWEVKWNDGLNSITVHIKEGEFLWRCHLKAISIEDQINSKHEFEEFKRQKDELEKALEEGDNKEQFVANCSRARTDEERKNNEATVIELETERISYNKYKFKEKEEYFKRLWTEDFTGVYKLSKDDENIVLKETNWNIKEEKETGTKRKVTISFDNKKLNCNISGDYTGDLGARKFKDGELKKILKMNEHNEEKEKKGYLIRNCRKNNMSIAGLTIRTTGKNEWEFSDLKKISEGMYENPAEIKHESASSQVQE